MDAFAVALTAHEQLAKGTKPQVQVEAASLIASIAADLGDDNSLEIALAVLESTQDALSEVGEESESLLLLNDLGRVWLKKGEPMIALSLLEAALEQVGALLAEPRGALEDSERSYIDLAQTMHLLGQIPLSILPAATTERSEHLLDIASSHLESVLETFTALGRAPEQAQVRDTMLQVARLRDHQKCESSRVAAL